MNCLRINSFSCSRRVKINCSTLLFKKLVNQSSQNNLCHQIRFDSIRTKVNLVSLLQRQLDQNRPLRWASRLVSLLQRRCQCDDLSTHIALSISESAYLMFLCQLVSLLQWPSFPSHSESATIGISVINRKVGRKASIELYVSAMNYTTSHRNMTFKEKKVMLRSVSGWNRA